MKLFSGTKQMISFILIITLTLGMSTGIKGNTSGKNYYISSIHGSNLNSGDSVDDPWSDFTNIPEYLSPGDKIYIERNSHFYQPLELKGSGSPTDFIELTTYGQGAKPIIELQNQPNDIALTWNNGSYIKINNLDIRHSRIGIYFRYTGSDSHEYIFIEDCDFTNMNCDEIISSFETSQDITEELQRNNGEYVWPAGIFFGGQVPLDDKTTKVQQIIIRRNSFHQSYTGIYSAWYYADSGQGDRVNRMTSRYWWIEDCSITGTTNGIFALDKASDSTIKNVETLSGSDKTLIMGTTGAYLQNCSNITIMDSNFSNIRNNGSADGCGIDFEGNNVNITFKNNLLANNEGPGILLCSTYGPNRNINIESSVLYNNNLRPYGPDHNYEILSWNPFNTGHISNTEIYKSNAYDYLSPDTHTGFGTSLLTTSSYSQVQSLPSFWLWDTNNYLGWTAPSHIETLQVSSGCLTGLTTGNDSQFLSPQLFINAYEQTSLNIRFASSLGNLGQVFFTTKEEPFFSPDKCLTFTYSPGYTLNTYIILTNNVKWRGIVTQLRFDPTIESGSQVKLDHLSIQ